MQQRFLLQILLLAQHVSGTTMPIIRSSRVLYSGCCLWYSMLWISSCWFGVKLRVMCPVCRMQQHPANRTHNTHQTSNRKTTAPNTTDSNHRIILLSSTNSSVGAKLIHLLVVHPGQRFWRLSDLQLWQSDLTFSLLFLWLLIIRSHMFILNVVNVFFTLSCWV